MRMHAKIIPIGRARCVASYRKKGGQANNIPLLPLYKGFGEGHSIAAGELGAMPK